VSIRFHSRPARHPESVAWSGDNVVSSTALRRENASMTCRNVSKTRPEWFGDKRADLKRRAYDQSFEDGIDMKRPDPWNDRILVA
jgi:hypothetical protein